MSRDGRFLLMADLLAAELVNLLSNRARGIEVYVSPSQWARIERFFKTMSEVYYKIHPKEDS